MTRKEKIRWINAYGKIAFIAGSGWLGTCKWFGRSHTWLAGAKDYEYLSYILFALGAVLFIVAYVLERRVKKKTDRNKTDEEV